MKKLLKFVCIIVGVVMLPLQTFAETMEMEEEEIHYDNHYVDYVYNNYLKNKKKQSYDIGVVRETTETVNYPVSATTVITTETDIVKKNKQVDNKFVSDEDLKNTKDTNGNPYSFYIGLGVGISDFMDYEVLQPAYSTSKATMKPETSSNAYITFGINNFITDAMNLEFEIGYVENDKIPTPHENGVYLIDYNQKMETYNVGASLIYNIGDIDSTFIPFIGFGAGMARIELSDFGIVSNNNISSKFESKSESKNTFYGKITAGIMYSMSETSKFTIGAEYVKYKDVDYKYLSLSDLARINYTAGLKFYF